MSEGEERGASILLFLVWSRAKCATGVGSRKDGERGDGSVVKGKSEIYEMVDDEREVARAGDVQRSRCCLSGNARSSSTSAAKLRKTVRHTLFSRMIDRRRLAGLDKCPFSSAVERLSAPSVLVEGREVQDAEIKRRQKCSLSSRLHEGVQPRGKGKPQEGG